MRKLLFLVLLLLQSVTEPATPDEKVTDFKDLAMAHLQTIKSRLKIENCIVAAQNKATRMSRGVAERTLAITWIHLYTQECKFTDTDDGSTGFFYYRMNQELREPSRKPSSKLFLESAQVINMALDYLKPKHFLKLYRGEKSDSIFNVTQITRKDFTSTSKVCMKALEYCCKDGNPGVFLLVQEAHGVYVAFYSINELEDEVLLKTGSQFKVESIVIDRKEIIARLVDECNMEDEDELMDEVKTQGFGIPKKLVLLLYNRASLTTDYIPKTEPKSRRSG